MLLAAWYLLFFYQFFKILCSICIIEVSHEPKELYTHNSPLCGCDNNKLKGVWADVVIVIDTSAVDDVAVTVCRLLSILLFIHFCIESLKSALFTIFC